MYVNPTNNLNLFLTGLYEPLETEIVRNHVRETDTVLDVGANIGYYTLLCAKLVGAHGQVFAFEPDTANFAWLKRNVRMNNLQNVVPVRKAISNKTGIAKLHLSERNRGAHSLRDSTDSRRTVQVETIRLTDYFECFKERIDFIKLDVEGAEFAALQGMETLLRDNPRLKIVTEFWPAGLEQSGADAKEYLELLLSFDFELSEINEETKRVASIGANELLRNYSNKNGTYTNLLCMRGK